MRALPLFAIALGLVFAASGCAAPDGKELELKSEKEYQTGSNIPRKERKEDGVKRVDPAALPPTGSSMPSGKGS